jgi:Hen1-like subunit of RNA repair complex/PNKP (polynucleotide 5'-kinase/3'-phosphatase) family adenylyltransferase-like protein
VLLTLTTTASPATDLGYLLHKHPAKVQPFNQAFGTAPVCYPEAGETRCTAALLLEVDPIRLVRTRGKGTPDFALRQYVNDRPYAASSLLASAMANVFRTALRGRCDARPELADRKIQPGVKCRGQEYLRIIYGPDYTEPEHLERLRDRHLGRKRSLAMREHALGVEALHRLLSGEPLWRVHQAVFAVLALESEPVDPRL